MRQRCFWHLIGLAAEDNTYARQLSIPYFFLYRFPLVKQGMQASPENMNIYFFPW